MDGMCSDQPHMAVDACAGVPARTEMFGVEAYGHHILLTEAEIRGKFHAERGVAVGPRAHFLSVEPHFGVGHRPVEVQIEALAAVFGRHLEVLPVPADAFPGQFAGISVKVGAEGALDGPVVRQVEGAPARVVESRRLEGCRFVGA